MTTFELYEKRKYRRIALQASDGVYCIISGKSLLNKAITVPAVEFSQTGFKFSVSPKMQIDFTQDNGLLLKAIVGSRNQTFTEPIAFQAKWQDFNVNNNQTYVGCNITKIATEAEKQFISFIREELSFAGQWIEGHQGRFAGRKAARPAVKPSISSPAGTDDRFTSLFNNTHTVMLLIDPATAAIVDANPAAVSYYGWSYKALTGKKITDIHTAVEEIVFQELEKARREDQQYFICQHRLASGDHRYVESFSGPVWFGDKQLLCSIVHDITDRKRVEDERKKLIAHLQKSMVEGDVLKGILHMCSFCKRIRDNQGCWENVDDYIGEHSQATISHSICPECTLRYYSEFLDND